MREGASFRGQPVLLLAGLMAGWIALRMALWAPPFELPHASPASRFFRAVDDVRRVVAGAPREQVSAAIAGSARPATLPWAPAFELRRAPWSTTPNAALGRGPVSVLPVTRPLEPPRVAVAQTLLFLAGMSAMEVPSAIMAYLRPPAASPGVPQAAPLVTGLASAARPSSRWSADGWLLLRQDNTTPLTAAEPSYGRSQVGAVIRYRLADGGVRPQAYLRASAAVAGPREQEAAVGLSARPLRGVPIRVAAEARLTETPRGTQVRPAIFAVTEVSQMRLPVGVRGEAYVQAGYVGGDFATAFVDGQARLERQVARVGESELTGGAGVWGAAQKGAARLDVGPTAGLSFRLGEARGRVAADYRVRVAGDAQPASGPALTVSAGF